MNEINLKPFHKLRIWVNEMPKLDSSIKEHLKVSIPASTCKEIEGVLVAVELYILAGARTQYGLLVGEFVSESSNYTQISIGVTEANLAIMVPWSLAKTTDQVFAGLPSDYTTGIKQGATEINVAQLLGSGCLQFHHGAHGLVGSSADLFRRLTHVVIYLLASYGEIPPTDKLFELLELS